MKFPYVKFGARTPEGGEYASFRPVIPIQVRYRDKTTRYMALLDSGADVSMFHAEMTEVLGIDLKSGTEMVFYGVGHGKSTGYIHEVEINVGGRWVTCAVAFCPGMIRPDPLTLPELKGFSTVSWARRGSSSSSTSSLTAPRSRSNSTRNRQGCERLLDDLRFLGRTR